MLIERSFIKWPVKGRNEKYKENKLKFFIRFQALNKVTELGKWMSDIIRMQPCEKWAKCIIKITRELMRCLIFREIWENCQDNFNSNILKISRWNKMKLTSEN